MSEAGSAEIPERGYESDVQSEGEFDKGAMNELKQDIIRTMKAKIDEMVDKKIKEYLGALLDQMHIFTEVKNEQTKIKNDVEFLKRKFEGF